MGNQTTVARAETAGMAAAKIEPKESRMPIKPKKEDGAKEWRQRSNP